MEPEIKKIDLVISDKNEKIKASKILREYTNRPYRDLLEAIENSEPSFTAELIPKQFYDGVKVVDSVIKSLEAEKISYDLFVNGKLESKEAISKINNQVKNITLKDFR